MLGMGSLLDVFPRPIIRAPSAAPPAIPATAAVPSSAGIFAFCAAVPTESPALPAADPTASPTLLSTPLTPLADCRDGRRCELLDRLERELLGRWERELLDPLERVARAERVAPALREPPDDLALGVRAAEAGRAGAAPFRRDDPVCRVLRVFV
jgi:hypothetical protein